MALTNLRIKVGEHWYTVQVGDLSHSPVQVTVEGEFFEVEVEDEGAEKGAVTILPGEAADLPRRALDLYNRSLKLLRE